MKLEPLIQLSAAWTCVSGRFGVHFFEGHLSLAEMERMEAIGDGWYRRNPGKLVELVVVLPSNARMSGEERSRMSRLIKRWEHVRDASATVILATGLVGAMQRSVLTGLMMIAPAPHPAKVFGSVADAAGWLTPYARALCGEGTTQRAIESAVDEVLAAFKVRATQ